MEGNYKQNWTGNSNSESFALVKDQSSCALKCSKEHFNIWFWDLGHDQEKQAKVKTCWSEHFTKKLRVSRLLHVYKEKDERKNMIALYNSSWNCKKMSFVVCMSTKNGIGKEGQNEY